MYVLRVFKEKFVFLSLERFSFESDLWVHLSIKCGSDGNFIKLFFFFAKIQISRTYVD
jgi:hypothetical protein